jgi:hypothetical protein
MLKLKIKFSFQIKKTISFSLIIKDAIVDKNQIQWIKGSLVQNLLMQ